MLDATAASSPPRPLGPVAIAALRPAPLVPSLTGIIVLFGVLGALVLDERQSLAGLPLGRFDLNGETTVPAAFSGLLLLAASAYAALGARQAPTRAERRPLMGLTALFVLMALDEVFGLHERLELAAEINFQALYVPLVLVAGALWLMTLRALGPRERWLWIGGAAAWGVAQILEFLQWGGGEQNRLIGVDDVLIHPWMIVPEETLEMAGSLLFVLALAGLALRFAPRRASPRSTPTGRG